MTEHAHEQRAIALDALDIDALKCLEQDLDRRLAVFAVADQLGEQGVVIGRDIGTRVAVGVNSESTQHRDREQRQPPRGRPEILGHVLGVQSTLDRVADELDIVLGEPERLAAGDPKL